MKHDYWGLLMNVVRAARNCLKPGQTDWKSLRKALADLDEYEKSLKVSKD